MSDTPDFDHDSFSREVLMQFRATPLPPSPHTADEARGTVRRRRQIRLSVVAAAVLLVVALPVTAYALVGKRAAPPGQTGPSTVATQPAATSSPSVESSPTTGQPSGTPSPPSPPSPPTNPYATGPNGLPVHLPSAWLAANQYPLASSYHWVLHEIGDGTQEGQVTPDCQNHSMTELGMRSYQLRNATNTANPTPDGYQGVEELFFFSDSTTASNAYSTMVGDMTGCQARDTAYAAGHNPVSHVAVAQTATIDAGSAWSRVVSTRVYLTDDLENHALIVQRGHVVAIVHVFWNTGSHPTYDTNGDAAVLHLMATELCQYGGSC